MRRHLRGDPHRLTATGGLAALSLDALSSVAYGPEAIVLVLVAAGTAAVRLTLPIAIAITVLLLVLVVSYRQVIAVHPNGGGAYAVAKKDLGRTVSLLAAASLVVDYVLTVAVSLAAGAASLGSVFPVMAHHLLGVTLAGLALITAINLIGIAESAKVLMGPTMVFVVSIFAIIIVGFIRPPPVAPIGTELGPIHATEALGLVLILKAFAAGCSSLTGVEAIANAVPQFRTPIVKRAQHTEVALGVLLAAMLLGLAALIKLHQVTPRGDVTVLAQLSAGAFGTGWPFYVTNLAVTLVLALAANTSFGGLPVLMQLLAKDHRLPHLFTLRAERPVYRYGVAALGLTGRRGVTRLRRRNPPVVARIRDRRLHRLHDQPNRAGPALAATTRSRGWARPHSTGPGAVLTAVAGVVLFASKFTEGAWLLLLLVPGLMVLFARIERYYYHVAEQLDLGRPPPRPVPGPSREVGDAMVIVPVITISKVVGHALQVAMRLGGEVVPVTVDTDPDANHRLCELWKQWDPGVDLRVLPSPHRTLVAPTVGFVRTQVEKGHFVIVLLAYIEPRRRRYRILHNQRGPLLATTIRARTDAIVATLPIRLERASATHSGGRRSRIDVRCSRTQRSDPQVLTIAPAG